MLSNCKGEVKRLIYQNGVAQQKETVLTFVGYLTALSEKSALMEAGKFGKLFKLSIQKLVDIQEADTVEIAGVSYAVQWVAQRKGKNLTLTTVILEKWV